MNHQNEKNAVHEGVRASSSARRRGMSAHEDTGEAFLGDPRDGGRSSTPDDLAELLAEDFISAATSGEDAAEDSRDAFATEEVGGPFVTTRDEGSWLRGRA